MGDDSWFGKADILRKVELTSKLGKWSYEAADTKLSKETKSGAILQLCLYSECVTDIQGQIPEYMHVVSPGEGFPTSSFRVLDYMAYYRFVKRGF